MEDKFDIQNIQEELKANDGYMVGVTFLKKGMLTHHFITNNFPTGDVEISLREIGKLAASALKTSENVNEPGK